MEWNGLILLVAQFPGLGWGLGALESAEAKAGQIWGRRKREPIGTRCLCCDRHHARHFTCIIYMNLHMCMWELYSILQLRKLRLKIVK